MSRWERFVHWVIGHHWVRISSVFYSNRTIERNYQCAVCGKTKKVEY